MNILQDHGLAYPIRQDHRINRWENHVYSLSLRSLTAIGVNRLQATVVGISFVFQALVEHFRILDKTLIEILNHHILIFIFIIF